MKTNRLIALSVFALSACIAMAQKTITVKSAEQFINAIGPDRTIIIDSKEALDITSALKHYQKIGKVGEADTYYYEGEEMTRELPDYSDDEYYDEEDAHALPTPYEEDEEDDYIGDEGDMEEEATEDDIKMRELAGYRPENLKKENYKAKKDGKVLEHVFYVQDSDGIGLEIRNCPNLTIKSKKNKAMLLATPRYVNVVDFANCPNLKLENLILGHTLEGTCSNGVLKVTVCDGVSIDGCDLFGCGTEGFTFDYSSNVIVTRSNVHDCSYFTLHINGCKSVKFNDCYFYRNKRFEQLNCCESSNVTFQGCTFENLKGKLFNLESPCYFEKCKFINCQMEHENPQNAANAVLKNCVEM